MSTKNYSFSTIYAPATLIGAAGLSVFRVSGPQAFAVAEKITRGPLPQLRMAVTRSFYNTDNQKLDEGVLVCFKGPNSFTGEDVVEFHCHGGLAVSNRMMRAFAAIEGLRLAEPGEFTRRAFEHGKIDLTQAEAIADLIHAETESQAVVALDQLGGVLRALYEGWADQLKHALAHIEADIDFSDEDVPDELAGAMRPTLETLMTAMSDHLDDGRLGERLREGFKIAIIGAPNAGKSSLINALSKRDVAIVTDIAGTTRDVLEVHLNLGGFAVVVADTAGLRETDDAIEREGVRRARDWAAGADMTLALFDGAQTPDAETLALINDDTILLSSKKDSGSVHKQIAGRDTLPISAKTGAGLQDLITVITQKLTDKSGLSVNVSRETYLSKTGLITRTRHRHAVQSARDALERALTAPTVDMMAEDVRLAVRALGTITGRVDVEDVLDVIFNEFCIGK